MRYTRPVPDAPSPPHRASQVGLVPVPAWFARDACEVARDLLGLVLRHRVGGRWLAARIVEAEAYYVDERASHSSLGRTPSREPMFAAPGTIYMYHARGGPSFNLSVGRPGDAVLCKAAVPHSDAVSPPDTLRELARRVPLPGGRPRREDRLLSGQTLLCRALGLDVATWSGASLDPTRLRLEDVGYRPAETLVTRRLGIPDGRDGHLPYRFVDAAHAAQATRNPLTRRGARRGVDYLVLTPQDATPRPLHRALGTLGTRAAPRGRAAGCPPR